MLLRSSGQQRLDNQRRVNFLLGVGCQKGGTSWLHSYLSASREVNFGFRKEYHIFDALYIDECRRFYEDLLVRLRATSEADPDSAEHKRNKILLSFYLNPDRYFDYFKSIAGGDRSIRVVGDITPSYAGLPQEAFVLIRKHLLERHLQPRVIFLMRDPVERCWSAVRMGRRDMRTRGKPVKVPEQHQLLKYIQTTEARVRTSYDRTARNIIKTFAEEEMLFEFYERLFVTDTARKICKFLDIKFVDPNFELKVNESAKIEGVTEDTIRKVALVFRNVYEWAFEKYGEECVRQLWPSARFIM